tara:strand:- start:363 stop:527 length:165 start_codon:yes stop_codon:yes gene_type:complete
LRAKAGPGISQQAGKFFFQASRIILDKKIKKFILDFVLGLKEISIGGLKVQNDI